MVKTSLSRSTSGISSAFYCTVLDFIVTYVNTDTSVMSCRPVYQFICGLDCISGSVVVVECVVNLLLGACGVYDLQL